MVKIEFLINFLKNIPIDTLISNLSMRPNFELKTDKLLKCSAQIIFTT